MKGKEMAGWQDAFSLMMTGHPPGLMTGNEPDDDGDASPSLPRAVDAAGPPHQAVKPSARLDDGHARPLGGKEKAG